MVDGNPQEKASAIGVTATGASVEDMQQVLDGKTRTTDIIEDKAYGKYISGYVPLKKSDGTILGILGADISADEVHKLTMSLVKQNFP